MNFRILLLPFSLFYYIGVFLRNIFFDFGLLKENRFKIPVIGIGNITAGGTGKTPHVEYLVRLLSANKNVAELSRGYGRKTSGFLYVSETSKSENVGDEPLQLKNKFPEIIVAVCESRKEGIEKILKDKPQTSLVLLDDAFQHRSVIPSLSILLLEYSKIFTTDFLLPAGNLREPVSAKKRADLIIVSKCPQELQENERKKIIKKINPEEKQKMFFSGIVYDKIHPVFNIHKIIQESAACLLVTGIADASGIKQYCALTTKLFRHLEFPDHHQFSSADIKNIIEIFSTIATENKFILTTEKDAMRLTEAEELKNIPVYFLPVEVKFQGNDKEAFNKTIIEHVGKN